MMTSIYTGNHQTCEVEENGFLDKHRNFASGALTVFTSLAPINLGKSYRLTASGLEKSTIAHMSQAHVNRIEFDSVDALIKVIEGISHSQAISSSLLKQGQYAADLTTKAEALKGSRTVARTSEYFEYPTGQRGVLILDYDAPESALSREALIDAFKSVCPAISDAGLVWWCSSSSMIYNCAEEIHGLRGQRLYVMMDDVSDTPRAGEVLAKRLWLQGHGRIVISSSGQLLKRTLVDTSMFQVARLDFIGGAICETPVVQRRGKPVSVGGEGWLDSIKSLPNLSADEELLYESLIKSASAQASAQAQLTREKWITSRLDTAVDALVKKNVDRVIARERAGRTLAQALTGELTGDFLIPLADGQFVSVSDVLQNKDLWDGKLTLDPLEPEYDSARPVGKLLLSRAQPCLKSFAHGNTNFLLRKQPKRFQVVPGEHAALVRTVSRELAKEPDVFIRSGKLLQIGAAGLMPVSRHALRALLSERFNLFALDRKGVSSPADFLLADADMLLDTLAWYPYARLKGVLSLPCMAPTGVPLLRSGYDVDHGVYLNVDDETDGHKGQCTNPTRADLVRALRIIWKPWSLFSFAQDHDRGAMLAAILTALSRPLINKAPGFLFTAPVQGSGKTNAARALNALVTGGTGSGTIAFSAGNQFETELGKLLLAMSLAGQTTLLIDNIEGTFNSTTLAKQITDDCLSGRVLGASTMHTDTLRLLVTLTGNNLQLGDDLVRRFLKIRIDTGVEDPQNRAFAFDPPELALQMRRAIAEAAITLLHGFVDAGMPQTEIGTAGFDQWSRMIRNAVLWVRNEGLDIEAGLGAVGDPATTILKTSAAEGGLLEPQRQLLMAAFERFGENSFMAKDIHRICINPSSSDDSICLLIQDAIVELLPDRSKCTIMRIGLQLSKLLDKIINGKKLITLGRDRGGSRIYAIKVHAET
jgi:hypothetical protein